MVTSPPPPLGIQIWHIDKVVFYARNPRKNDAAVDRMCQHQRIRLQGSGIGPPATAGWWTATSG